MRFQSPKNLHVNMEGFRRAGHISSVALHIIDI